MKNSATNQNGLSILETMVSLTILGIVMSGLLPSFSLFLGQNSFSHRKAAAMQALEGRLDTLRLTQPSDLPSSGDDGGVSMTVGKHTFTVTTHYCRESSFCTSNQTRQLSVEASFGGQEIAAINTVYTSLR